MRLKDLEMRLQTFSGFQNPKVRLEQYATTAHLAARLAYTANTEYCDVADNTVLDLGSGCGILSAAMALSGSPYVLGVEIDDDAMLICQENTEDLPQVELILGDALLARSFMRLPMAFETVVTNPPFGTKNNAGMDVAFLNAALSLASCSVYSFHKTSTRPYLTQKFCNAKPIAAMSFELPAQYRFHRHDSVSIHVDLIRTRVSK